MARQPSEKISSYRSPDDYIATSQKQLNASNQVEWVSIGLSYIYLAHFASLYTQLPGLYGNTGLLPASLRVPNLEGLWALNSIPISPEAGLEAFAATGIVLAASQIIFGRKLREGPIGVLTFGILWLLWHDLVMAGGRFTAYQMDLLLLDAAPISVLAASGLVPEAGSFGYRWLLARLYIGAGAVKILSCDKSWKDLSAVHWHFQSQPLPNPVGEWAYLHLPQGICEFMTVTVLVAEMAAPFLFLAPSAAVRRFAFVLNVVLMVGIAAFGNFGPLQILLIVIGLALLDDLPPLSATVPVGTNQGEEQTYVDQDLVHRGHLDEFDALSVGLSTVCVALSAGGAAWAMIDVGARCPELLPISPLVYDLIALGGVAAIYPLLSEGIESLGPSLVSLAILASSSAVMANGLGVNVPLQQIFDAFDIGAASPYGLFAIITGVEGRPVAALEASTSSNEPLSFVSIPLLYQINDPSAPLPMCFPHFPRLDWTLWFVPLGGPATGWLTQLFEGIIRGDESIIGLLDKEKYHQLFPTEPPPIVRMIPRTYQFSKDEAMNWNVVKERNDFPYERTFERGDFVGEVGKGVRPWPSTPVLRTAAEENRPEHFVWGCIGTTATAETLTRRIRMWLNESRNMGQ